MIGNSTIRLPRNPSTELIEFWVLKYGVPAARVLHVAPPVLSDFEYVGMGCHGLLYGKSNARLYSGMLRWVKKDGEDAHVRYLKLLEEAENGEIGFIENMKFFINDYHYYAERHSPVPKKSRLRQSSAVTYAGAALAWEMNESPRHPQDIALMLAQNERSVVEMNGRSSLKSATTVAINADTST